MLPTLAAPAPPRVLRTERFAGCLLGASLLAAAFFASVAFPLATYTAVLAAFGLAHVLSELNYLDRRFGARLADGLLLRLAGPVLVAVTARGAAILGLIAPALDVPLELAAAAALLLAVAPRMRHRPAAAMATSALLAGGAVFAPFEVLLGLAILHNLTPLGFVAEALGGRVRRRATILLVISFVALPLLIASGLPGQWLDSMGLADCEANLFAAAGPLGLNLGAYVPRALALSFWAVPIFSACVFAQIMHYAAVILLYPRLPGGAGRPVLPWPRRRRLALLVAVPSAVLFAGFAIDYAVARQIYGLAALVHAWLEIPILALALGGWRADHRAMA